MRTYRELFALPEFTPMFWTMSARALASTVQGIALGTLVFVRTGSPLLSALSMFGPSAAQVIGAMTLLSHADRVRPRAALTAVAVAYAALTLVLAVPGLPVAVLLVIVLTGGLINSFGSGVQWGLFRQVVPRDGFVLARSLMTMMLGFLQIAGFGLGGILVTATSPRWALLLAALAFAASAGVARFGLRDHPARGSGRGSIRATLRDNRWLLGDPERRTLYLAMWVPNGLIVGCEALFIPYSTRWAGLLLSATAVGMLAGDVVVGRVLPPTHRARFATPLRTILAVPYLLFAITLPVGLAAVVAAVASVGYAATLLQQERLVALVPDELSGHALGLQGSGMLTAQAVGAAIAGSIAHWLSPGSTMAVLGLASLVVTVALTPGLARADRAVHAARAEVPTAR